MHMGGYGSGQYQSYDAKSVVEHCHTLSISAFPRAGIRWDMSTQGTITEGKSDLVFSIRDNILTLTYTFTKGRNTGRRMQYGIHLSRTTPYFGGSRLWFHCPHCNQRAGKLYLAPAQLYYLCRDCADVTYQSTREMSRAKAWQFIMREERRVQRLLEKYGQAISTR